MFGGAKISSSLFFSLLNKSNPAYIWTCMTHQRYGRTDRRTDNVQSQYRVLHYVHLALESYERSCDIIPTTNGSVKKTRKARIIMRTE